MIRYAIWFPQNRPGELEFLCHNQRHWSRSLENVKKEVENLIEGMMEDFDCPMTREEAIEELGGEPVIYKLDIRRVK